MKHHLIWWMNYLIIVFIIIFITGSLWIHTSRSALAQNDILLKQQAFPHSTFTPPDNNYTPLGNPSLQLEFSTPKMRLPDLRTLLIYEGRNLRPDAKDGETLFFRLASDESHPFQAYSGKKTYLIAQNGSYFLSPENRQSTLWFEPRIQESLASIRVGMTDEKGETLSLPQDRALFTLAEKAVPAQNKTFMLDQFRADATLLARQKARWSGVDLFLEDLGGAEFQNEISKQRVVFGEGEDQYAIYLQKGDMILWKEGKWVSSVGEQTTSYYLARVSKIEDRVMSLELFDILGKTKINLNLLRVQDPKIDSRKVLHDFQFIGARTQIHSLFQLNHKREIVGPDDWFLLTKDGWIKLRSGKEIDAYVAGNIQGVLLVINGIDKQSETKSLKGTLYSSSRASSEPIFLPLSAHINEKETKEPIDLEAIPQG